MSENEQCWYSIKEAAAYLGVTPYTVWAHYVKTGKLATTRVVGYRNRLEHRIAESNLKAFQRPKRGAKPKSPHAIKVYHKDITGIVWDGVQYDSLQALATVKGVSREAVRRWKVRGYVGDSDRLDTGRPRKK